MIEDLLTRLKMRGELSALPSLEEIKDKGQFLIGLLQAEAIHRENQAAKRRLSQAKFPIYSFYFKLKIVHPESLI